MVVLPSPVGSEARLGLVLTLALVLVCADPRLLLPLLLPVVEGVPISRFLTNTLTVSRSCAPLSSLTLTTKVKVESLLTSGAGGYKIPDSVISGNNFGVPESGPDGNSWKISYYGTNANGQGTVYAICATLSS